MENFDFSFKSDLVVSLARTVSWFQKMRAIFYPVKLGIFQPVELVAPDTFYLFKCDNCHRLSVDHFHGFDTMDSCQRLECHLCN